MRTTEQMIRTLTRHQSFDTMFSRVIKKVLLTTISKGDIMNAKQLKEQGIDVNKLIPVDLTNKGERATIEIKKSGFWSAMKKQKHYRLR